MSAEMELGTDRYGAIRVAQTLAAQAPEDMLAAATIFVEFLEQGPDLNVGGSHARGVVEQARKINRHCNTLVEGNSVVLDELLSRHGQRILDETTSMDLVYTLLKDPRPVASLSSLARANRYKDNPVRLGHVGLRAIGLAITTLGSVEEASIRSMYVPDSLKDMLSTLSHRTLRIVPAGRSEPSRTRKYGSWY